MVRSNYEKKKLSIFLFCCIGIFVTCLFTGCSTLKTIDNTDVVVGNQVAATKLEDTIGELDRASTRSRERLEIVIRDSRKIEDGLSRLEYLFDSYESEVNRLLDEIDRIRREAAEDQRTVKDASKDKYNMLNNTGGNDTN